jgi:hypothetical protein
MTIGQYNPRSRGGVAYADLTREILARGAGGTLSEASSISAPAPAPGTAGGDVDPQPDKIAEIAPDELESLLGAEAPEGIIDG